MRIPFPNYFTWFKTGEPGSTETLCSRTPQKPELDGRTTSFVRFGFRIACCFLVSVFVGRLVQAYPGEFLEVDRHEQAEAARRHPRVQEFLERHADAELIPTYSDEFKVWIVELRVGNRKLGMVSVKDGRVLEVDLKEAGPGPPTRAAELVENTSRIRDLRQRFAEARLVLSRTGEAAIQSFELVVDGREVAAGIVNAEAGWTRFRDEEGRLDLDEKGGQRGLLAALLQVVKFPPGEGGLFWFSTAVTLLVIFPFRRPVGLQSLDVLAILALFPLSTIVWGHPFQTYLTLFLIMGHLCARCLWKAFDRRSFAEPANVSLPAMLGALILVFLMHVQAVATRAPDDSGIWSVFGGQYVCQHGRLPYGQIGEGATYGPLLYAIHAPVSYVLPPTARDPDRGTHVIVDRHNIKQVGYQNCDFLPSKVVVLAFDIALLIGLAVIGRQLHSLKLGVALALVYAVNGLTIDRDLLFISHIAPTACVVLAIACRRYPAVSGMLLGCGASILFWPAFLIPLWLGFFAHRGRNELIKSSVAVGAVGIASLLAIRMLTEPLGSRGPFGVFLDSTWGHQEGGGPYSDSKFGLWGQWIEHHPDRAEVIANVKTGVRWSYFAVCLLPAGLALRRRPIGSTTLIALSAVLALGLQFWKTHGGGLYTGWYLPLVVATLLSQGEVEHS